MKLLSTSSLVLCLCGALLLSCGSAPLGPPVTTATWNGGEPNEAPAPASVTASIASVTLGDNCAVGQAPIAGDALVAGRCAGDCGGGPTCRPTTLQIALTAGAGAAAGVVEIASVALYDARTNTRIATLTPTAGQVWDGSGAYGPWDGRVAASQSLQVSYRLHGIDWSSIQQQTGFGPHDGMFRVQVMIRVNGEQRELASEELGREPMIVT